MASELIDLTKEVPQKEGLEDIFAGLPINLGGVAHKTIGVSQDGDVLAYPVGKGHGEETPTVWIDPTGKKKDEHGLTQDQRRTVEYAAELPVLSGSEEERVEQLKNIDGPGICKLIIGVHSVLAPHVDPSPIAEQTVIHKNQPGKKSEVVDELPMPEDRYPLVEVVSKIINTVANRVETEGSPTKESGQAALIRIANLVGLATVIAHPFDDANGRTARALAYLIRFGVPKTPEEFRVFQIVSAKKGDDPNVEVYREVKSIRPVIKQGQPNHKSWQDAINFAFSPKIPLTREGQEEYEAQHSKHFKTIFDNRLIA